MRKRTKRHTFIPSRDRNYHAYICNLLELVIFINQPKIPWNPVEKIMAIEKLHGSIPITVKMVRMAIARRSSKHVHNVKFCRNRKLRWYRISRRTLKIDLAHHILHCEHCQQLMICPGKIFTIGMGNLRQGRRSQVILLAKRYLASFYIHPTKRTLTKPNKIQFVKKLKKIQFREPLRTRTYEVNTRKEILQKQEIRNAYNELVKNLTVDHEFDTNCSGCSEHEIFSDSEQEEGYELWEARRESSVDGKGPIIRLKRNLKTKLVDCNEKDMNDEEEEEDEKKNRPQTRYQTFFYEDNNETSISNQNEILPYEYYAESTANESRELSHPLAIKKSFNNSETKENQGPSLRKTDAVIENSSAKKTIREVLSEQNGNSKQLIRCIRQHSCCQCTHMNTQNLQQSEGGYSKQINSLKIETFIKKSCQTSNENHIPLLIIDSESEDDEVEKTRQTESSLKEDDSTDSLEGSERISSASSAVSTSMPVLKSMLENKCKIKKSSVNETSSKSLIGPVDQQDTSIDKDQRIYHNSISCGTCNLRIVHSCKYPAENEPQSLRKEGLYCCRCNFLFSHNIHRGICEKNNTLAPEKKELGLMKQIERIHRFECHRCKFKLSFEGLTSERHYFTKVKQSYIDGKKTDCELLKKCDEISQSRYDNETRVIKQMSTLYASRRPKKDFIILRRGFIDRCNKGCCKLFHECIVNDSQQDS